MSKESRSASRNRRDNGNHGQGGRFQPGNSANPNGRPRLLPELKEHIRVRGQELVDRLFELVEAEPQLVRRGRRTVTVGPSHRERILAIRTLLAYGYGKPVLAVEISGTSDSPFMGVARAAIDEVIAQAEAVRPDPTPDN